MGVEGADFEDDDEDEQQGHRRPDRFDPFPLEKDNAESTEFHDRGEMDTDEGLALSADSFSSGPLNPGAEIRGFRITELLGEGATGAVYGAVELKTRNRVALKLLYRSDANTINRLKRGFRALAEVFHPNLVMLFGLHQFEERCFITMERVDGQPLLKAIAAEDIRDPKAFYARVYAILRESGRALHALHSNQLVHRDIKPNNLLIDTTGRLRLIDYGMVGSIDPIRDPLGHRSYVAGNRRYMAPEVLSKQNYPPGSDIYSLGRVTAKLLRSCHPFSASMKMDADGLMPIDVPKRLRKLIHRMLAADVSSRPTAWEVASTASDASEATVSLLVNPGQLQIIGRDDAMQQVRRWLSRMVGGQSGRLHISAPPGIGKTRFLAAVAEQLKEHKWLQIFESRCRRREEVPLQAFDEMVDALARRYSGANAGQLELDPVSTEILRSAFPVLRGVLKKAGEVPRDRSLGLAEANDASIQLAAQVCRHGPVILIIDDLQWADNDSLSLIRRLEIEVPGLFGVITASHEDFQPPHLSPTDILKLRPLTTEESSKLLHNHLLLRRIRLPATAVERIVQLGEGNCHHLLQLAACVSAVASEEIAALSDLDSLDIRQLWQRRFAQLSPQESIILTSVVAAGGPVDIGDVLEVTAIGESGRAVVGRLLQENWLNKREQTHHIEIFHDTIGEALTEFLPASQLRTAHAQWAQALIAAPQPVGAARIAGHLLEAGKSQEATEYTILAAEEASKRYAFGESARWHYRTAQLLSGAAALEHLHSAADGFTMGGQSAQAAKTYLEIAAHPQETLPSRYRALAVESFIRAGEIHRARDAISELARRLGLPLPKPQWLSKLMILKNLLLLRWRGGYQMPVPTQDANGSREYDRDCFRLSRALSAYDNVYAAELLTTALVHLRRCESPEECIHASVAYVAFGSYDAGWWRQDSRRLLGELTVQAEQIGSPEAIANAANAAGFHHWLMGEFAESLTPLEKSANLYRHQCTGMIFESVHTQFPCLACYFMLGQIAQLVQVSQAMIRDARERDDRFTLQIATTGFAAPGLLFLGEVDTVKRFNRSAAAPGRKRNWQIFHSLQTIGLVFQKMYAGRPQQALKLMQLHHRNVQHSGFFRMQIGRVWWNWLRGTLALQLAIAGDDKADPHQLDEVMVRVRKLTAEQLPVASLLSQLLEARVEEIREQHDAAAVLYRQVAQAADEQQLEPFRLLALDGLDVVRGNKIQQTRLNQYLSKANVHDPAACERLYTAPRNPQLKPRA